MKRSGGLIAGLLVVMTYLGVSNLPKSPEIPGGAESKPVKAQLRQPSGSNSDANEACKEIGDRLQRFLKDKNAPSTDEWKFIESCYPAQKVPSKTKEAVAWPDIQFAIATVPNPVSTHLPLLFDRVVESIQQAAQDDHYTYDSAYFPWEDTKKDYAYFRDQRESEQVRKAQVEQPGVMTFRGPIQADSKCAKDSEPYQCGLVVFVVGEQPTGGIDDTQFENALRWINQLTTGRAGDPLRILGPMFSGSFPSLRKELERALLPKSAHGTPELAPETKIRVASGTASSSVDYKWFQNWIQSQAGSGFWTVTADDTDMVSRFCAYVGRQGYRNVAFLAEDETAFGNLETSKETCPGPISLYYPRDIAMLRSAYESQSVFSSTRPATNANPPSTTLRGDLSEPASSDHDTVRSYGNQLTPIAQEAILLDIARRLKEAGAQFIILVSTNSLDQIFLTEFLHRAYPNGRLVISGADLLFARGAESRLMRGAMLLSAYPLLDPPITIPPNQPRPEDSRIFAEDFSAGEYFAGRALFQDTPVQTPPPTPWLSVVSHGQFWPLAALLKDSNNPQVGEETPQRFGIPTVMWIFVFACFLWTLLHAVFCRTASIMGSPRARAYFAPIPGWRHPAFIALGSFLLIALAVAIAASCGLFWRSNGVYPYQDGKDETGLSLSLFVILATAAVACWKNYASAPAASRHWQWWSAVAAIICLIATFGLYYFLISKLTFDNAIAVYWRNVNLTSGVSGLLSQVLLIAGMYLWFWCNLRGLAHFGEDRPTLPLDRDLPKLDLPKLDLPNIGAPELGTQTSWMPMFSQDKAGRNIEDKARPLTKDYLIRLIAIFPVTVALSALVLQGFSIRTLGELTFGRLIFFWVCLCIAIILTDGIEMWIAWNELRHLLIFLDRLPLRRTLRSLKGLAWGSIWKLSGNVLEDRYRAITFQFESRTHLTNLIRTFDAGIDLGEEPVQVVLEKLERLDNTNRKFAKWFVKVYDAKSVGEIQRLSQFQRTVASTAGVVIANVLMPAWQKEKESLILAPLALSAQPSEDETKNSPIPAGPLKPHIRAAEEFVVLPYLAFIQNILGRIRTIGLGSMWLFLGATLAVSTYPFDPLNILGLIFLVVFVLYGAVAVVVYSQISRDATLSHITDTNPGELGWEFWQRVAAFGAGPLFALLTTLFPSISEFVFSWLQPSAQALK